MWPLVKPLPGAEQLIQQLVARDIPIAVPPFYDCSLMKVGYLFASVEVSFENSTFTR